MKNIKVVEAFSAIDTVIFDKTGTITNVAGQQMQFHGRPLSYDEKVAVRSLVRHSAHPLSRRIYEALSLIPVVKPDSFEEVTGKGVCGAVNGLKIKVGSSRFTGGEGQGVFVSVNGEVAGFYEVKSRYRTGLDTVLGFFGSTSFSKHRTGQPVWLLSGDHDQEAVRLRPFFPDTQVMRFNQSPQDKLDFVKDMQSDGRKVMMIGDGLNDAGALRQSDLGIVVAEDTNNFTPACDAILNAGEFPNLPSFVRLSRAGVRVVHWSYAVAFTYNAIGLAYAVTG
ncbi:MAG: HAD family hydrolase, partial [Bacteroidota bacterium]